MADNYDFSKNLLRWWEIRSWVHLNDPKILNKKKDNWGHHQREPFLGIGKAQENKLFQWTKEYFDKDQITSYFFPDEKYRILKRIYSTSNFFEEGGKHSVTGIIMENTTNNSDGLKNNVLYICFRETTSPLQNTFWKGSYGNSPLENVLFKYNEINVHGGMWNVYKDIRHNLIDFLDQNRNYSRVLLCGMSLGGALAQCACIDTMCFYPGNQIYLILYASPKVYTGNTVSFLEEYKINCFRIEADSFDSVPGFPRNMNNSRNGWMHYGTSYRLEVKQEDMVTKRQSSKDKKKSHTNSYNIYTGNFELENGFPTSLIFGPESLKNFHTRTNYQKYLYYYAKLNGVELPDL